MWVCLCYYEENSAAEKAVEGCQGLKIDGREVAVDFAVEKSKWEQMKDEEVEEEEDNESSEEQEEADSTNKDENDEEEEDKDDESDNDDASSEFDELNEVNSDKELDSSDEEMEEPEKKEESLHPKRKVTDKNHSPFLCVTFHTMLMPNL